MSSSVVSPADEIILWSRLCKGDRHAFTDVYNRYFPLLFEYCSRFSSDRNLIKDVLQDFFLGLLREETGNLSDIQHLKSYLFVATRRKLMRALTQTGARSGPALPQAGEEPDEEGLPEFHLELSPELSLISKEQDRYRSRRLQETIDGLTTRQREAVYLYFYENVSYESIAEIMGLKEVKYARTLVYRALTELRMTLGSREENFLKKTGFS